MKNFNTLVAWLAFCGFSQLAVAQDHHDLKLHVNPRWKQCSFQLDPSLTQEDWQTFTREAGLVSYFRPLTDANPMGKKNFEVSLLQWQTAFDDAKPAWNNTFVHPDSVHWLKETSRLKFPGITARFGITDRLDAAVYFTKSPGANYGFAGGQLQYNLINESVKKWSASARASFVSMYGPEDLNFNTIGLEALASKEFKIYSDWASVAPYVGVSGHLSNAHEKSERVNLNNEHVLGGQGMVGAVLKISAARLGVEYSFAKLSTVSFKLGVVF